MTTRGFGLWRVLHMAWVVLLVGWGCGAQAQVPQLLNYQGFLTTPGGVPINVPVVMTFRIYNASSGGSPLYTETHLSVPVSNGIFDEVIGSVTPLVLPFDVPYWLTVTVNADAEMSPRQAVASSPYALNSRALSATATVAGSQLTGSVTAATVPTANLTGTIGTAQIANGAVDTAQVASGAITQSKLSAAGGGSGQVLTSDGSNLAWQTLPETEVWAGAVGNIPGGLLAFTFIGPQANILIPPGPGRRLTTNGSAALGLVSGGPVFINIDICYQLGAGPVTEFGLNYFAVAVTTTRSIYAVSDSQFLAPGTYRVGLCVINEVPTAINGNDWTKGTVVMTPN